MIFKWVLPLKGWSISSDERFFVCNGKQKRIGASSPIRLLSVDIVDLILDTVSEAFVWKVNGSWEHVPIL